MYLLMPSKIMCDKLAGRHLGTKTVIHIWCSQGRDCNAATGATSQLPSLGPLRCARQVCTTIGNYWSQPCWNLHVVRLNLGQITSEAHYKIVRDGNWLWVYDNFNPHQKVKHKWEGESIQLDSQLELITYIWFSVGKTAPHRNKEWSHIRRHFP